MWAERKGEGPAAPPPLYTLNWTLQQCTYNTRQKDIIIIQRGVVLLIDVCSYYYYYYVLYGTWKLAWCEHFLKDTRGMVEWWGEGVEGRQTDAMQRRETLPEKRALFHIFSLSTLKSFLWDKWEEVVAESAFVFGLLQSGEQTLWANADFHYIRPCPCTPNTRKHRIIYTYDETPYCFCLFDCRDRRCHTFSHCKERIFEIASLTRIYNILLFH